MATQTIRVTLTAQDTKTFVFTKPSGNYGKTAPGVIPTGGSDPQTVAGSYGADVDNGDGTMTGTLNLSAPITGTADLVVYDR